MRRLEAPSTSSALIRGNSLAVLVRSYRGVPFEEGLTRTNRANRVLVPAQKALGAARPDSFDIPNDWVFPCWTGTIVASVEPGYTFCQAAQWSHVLGTFAIEYIEPASGKRWLFPIPEAHMEMSNAALFIDHPTYTLEIDGRNRIVHASWVSVFERTYGRFVGPLVCWGGDKYHPVWVSTGHIGGAGVLVEHNDWSNIDLERYEERRPKNEHDRIMQRYTELNCRNFMDGLKNRY